MGCPKAVCGSNLLNCGTSSCWLSGKSALKSMSLSESASRRTTDHSHRYREVQLPGPTSSCRFLPRRNSFTAQAVPWEKELRQLSALRSQRTTPVE